MIEYYRKSGPLDDLLDEIGASEVKRLRGNDILCEYSSKDLIEYVWDINSDESEIVEFLEKLGYTVTKD